MIKYRSVNLRRVYDGKGTWNDYPENAQGAGNDTGFVFWLDGESMCKIKRSDYGFKWLGEVECSLSI